MPDEAALTPPMRSPEPLKPVIDSVSESGAQPWMQGTKENVLFNPRYGEISQPPDTPDEFAIWANELAAAMVDGFTQEWGAEALRRNLYGKDVTPTAASYLLTMNVEALNRWQKAERAKNTEAALVSMGEVLAYGKLMAHLGLEKDRQYLERLFRGLPTVDAAKFDRSFHGYLDSQRERRRANN